jgi:hypothetical protein
MPQIMGERRRFSQFRRQAMIQKRLFDKQIVGDRARNLRHLDAVRQPRAVKISLSYSENLSLPLQSSECSAVKNTIPIPLCGVAVILGGHRTFRVSTLQQEIVHGQFR